MKQKKAQNDFTMAQLPHNRFQVFTDCFKLYWGKLLGMGGILLLFAIPMFIVTFYFDLALAQCYSQFLSAAITESEYLGNCYVFQFYRAVGYTVCYCIMAVPLAGISRVVRQMIWAEPVFFGQDLFTGIKSNSGSFVFCGFIIGLAGVYNGFVRMVFSESLLTSLPVGIELFLIFPVLYYIAAQTVVYSNSMGKMIKNGFILYIKALPVTIIFILVSAAFYFTDYISLIYVKYIVMCVLIVLIVPLFVMSWLLYSFSVFDKYINKDNYPSIYRKGIFGEIQAENNPGKK